MKEITTTTFTVRNWFT